MDSKGHQPQCAIKAARDGFDANWPALVSARHLHITNFSAAK
jgi:predicted HD phosphohydrolase